MDLENLDSCNICMDSYDEDIRPHCLPCGHSFCGSCLENFIQNEKLQCPFCQRSHRASSASDFPIDYGMESLISELRKAKLVSHKDLLGSSSDFPCQSESEIQEFYRDQLESLRRLIQIGKEIKCDALKYKEFLNQRQTEHEELIPRIYELVHRNEDMVRQIDMEDKKLTDILKEGEEYQDEAASLVTYEKARNTDIITASEEVERSIDILEEWSIRLQKQMPNIRTIKFSEKVKRDTTAALTVGNSKDNEARRGSLDFSRLSLTIMDKLDRIRGEYTLTIEDLKNKSEVAEKSLKLGHVYAIQTKEGRVRSARVTVEDQKVYLHHLQDTEPPVHALTIEHNELLKILTTDTTEVFMDLAWEGLARGRLHILLFPDTPLARHFRVLCSGELGPTYAYSRLLSVATKGHGHCVYVSGGDYENKHGKGGAAVISGLRPNDKIYERELTSGSIWAINDSNDGPKIAQFSISISQDKRKIKNRVFGQVQDGLEVLRAAARLRDIRKAIIEDCGIILPL